MSGPGSQIRLALFLVAIVAAQALHGQSAEFAVLRRNVVDYYTAAGADRGDPHVAAALVALESQALSLTAPGYLRGDGSWTDIDYDSKPTGVWSPWDHFRRLMVLAKAYSTPGQRLYHDPLLLQQIEDVLSYLQEFYAPIQWEEGNWWFWTIGPALDLGPALVLVSDDIDPSVRDDATRSLAAHVGMGPGLNDYFERLDGQNAVWSSINHTMLAILRGDSTTMGRARDRLALACAPGGSEGLKSDLSFQQHGPQLYTGGYGGSFAYEMSKYFLFARGTKWAIGTTDAAWFSDFMVEGIAWSLYQNYFDVSVIGREVSYPSASGFNGLASLLNMSAVPSSRQGEIRAAAAMMITTWPGTLRPELAGLVASLRGVPPAWPSGHRHYSDSDFTILRRPGWYASIRMFSSRTESGEGTNGENLLGSRQSDGRLNLVIKGDEYFAPNAWPALDWSRLPGITVEQKPGIANAKYGRGTTSFVGGISNGSTGVSAMELAPLGSSLRARKAWIFFDDSIVFLTSGIKCLSGSPVETVIDQRPVGTGPPLVIDGIEFKGPDQQLEAYWAAGDGIGYYFPDGESIRIREEERTGSWRYLAVSGSAEPVSRQMRSIWVDHGASVTDASAGYVIVPDKSTSGMRAWAGSRPVTILANDDAMAAARDERTGETGIVFWKSGSIAGVTSFQPAIVLRSELPRQVRLSVTDPSRAYTRLWLTLDGRYRVASGDAVESPSGHSTSLLVSVSGGKTTTIVLDDLSRTRSVRR